MEQYFATIFEYIRHERSLILLLSVVEPDILKRSNFTEDEIDFNKSFALEMLHRQRILGAQVAIALLESILE